MAFLNSAPAQSGFSSGSSAENTLVRGGEPAETRAADSERGLNDAPCREDLKKTLMGQADVQVPSPLRWLMVFEAKQPALTKERAGATRQPCKHANLENRDWWFRLWGWAAWGCRSFTGQQTRPNRSPPSIARSLWV